MRATICPQEHQKIVEYSFNEKNRVFVFRFLEGTSYAVKLTELPKRLQSRKINWHKSVLNKLQTAIQTRNGRKLVEIEWKMIQKRGKLL